MNYSIICFLFTLISVCYGFKPALRIMGGNAAPDHAYPYLAYLSEGFTSSDGFVPKHGCGGAIIHQFWILTAAHCLVQSPDSNSFMALVGTNELIYEPPYAYPIGAVIRHERHTNAPPNYFDIGLAKTVNAITLSATVQTIALPSQDPVMQGSAVLAGFGMNTSVDVSRTQLVLPNYYPKYLQQIQLNLIDREQCKQYWPDVDETQICTMNGAGQGACPGDSGSGLVANREVIGVVSFGSGYGCALGYPEVFTNVYRFLDWIHQNTNYAV